MNSPFVDLIPDRTPSPDTSAGQKPPLLDRVLLEQLLLQTDKSYKIRDDLRWPVDVTNDPALPAQALFSGRLKRAPSPIFAFRENGKEDQQETLDSLDDDSEIDEVTMMRASPLTPLEHSPILLEAILNYIENKFPQPVDPLYMRSAALEVMRKLQKVLEDTRETFAILPGIKSPTANGSFLLNVSRTSIPDSQEAIDRALKRHQAILNSFNLNRGMS